MKFYTKSYLRNLSESVRREKTTFSSKVTDSKNKTSFDIFLSHSYKDKEYIEALFSELTDRGYSVYVDWIVDSLLQRNNVDKTTVEHIRKRMKQSKSLIYATSDNASVSKWMPWELGYMDGKTGRCAILPITDYEESSFVGQEFLSVYPIVGKDYIPENRSKGEVLWVNESHGRKVQMNSWKDEIKF